MKHFIALVQGFGVTEGMIMQYPTSQKNTEKATDWANKRYKPGYVLIEMAEKGVLLSEEAAAEQYAKFSGALSLDTETALEEYQKGIIAQSKVPCLHLPRINGNTHWLLADDDGFKALVKATDLLTPAFAHAIAEHYSSKIDLIISHPFNERDWHYNIFSLQMIDGEDEPVSILITAEPFTEYI